MKQDKMILMKKMLPIAVLFFIIFFLSAFQAYAGGLTDVIKNREKVLKNNIPRFSIKSVRIDTSHKPSDLSRVSWICFKENYLFTGYDRIKNIFFSIYPCAVGRNTGQKKRSGDMRTPEGDFRVQQIQEVSWWPPYTDSKTGEKIGYGPYFIRIDTGRWKGIGIHGTDDDHLNEIGSNASHGCIRLKNQDLLEVVANSRIDQQVLILP